MRGLIFFLLITLSLTSHAQYKHERIKRITVFPIKIDSNDAKESVKPAENAWWAMRESLTDSKRFQVASKNFMEAKDLFQPRAELQPSDVLILGRLLDAHALMSVFLKDRKMSLRVYEAKNGLTLWAGDIELHPALPISKQIEDAAQKLLADFVASIPYQGYVIVDPLIGAPLYAEKDRKLFKVDVGSGTQITVGDDVQIIRVTVERLNPIFQNGSDVEVYAEGKVVQVDRSIVTVQLVRMVEGEQIKVDALVRVPNELRRLKEVYGMYDDPNKNLDFGVAERISEIAHRAQDEKKPLITSLSWIGNLLVILLLAF